MRASSSRSNPAALARLAEVAFTFFGSANIVKQQGKDVAVESSAAHDLHRRNAKSFLVDLATRAHRTSVGPTDIGVMRASSDEKFGSGIAPMSVGPTLVRWARV